VTYSYHAQHFDRLKPHASKLTAECPVVGLPVTAPPPPAAALSGSAWSAKQAPQLAHWTAGFEQGRSLQERGLTCRAGEKGLGPVPEPAALPTLLTLHRVQPWPTQPQPQGQGQGQGVGQVLGQGQGLGPRLGHEDTGGSNGASGPLLEVTQG
jgi:hypothetical protein